MNGNRRSFRARALALPPLLLLLANACASGRPLPGAEFQKAFDRAAERAPTVQTLHSLAHVMAAQGRQGECRLVLERLIADHPRFLAAYNELAELHMRADHVEAAMKVLQQGLTIDPHDGVLLNNLGMCHFVRGDFEPALEQFTRATAAVPGDARYRANMAAALGLLSRPDEALAIYYQILPPSEAHYDLAVLCEAAGDEERARQEFKLADK